MGLPSSKVESLISGSETGTQGVFFQGFSILFIGSDFKGFFFDGIFTNVQFPGPGGVLTLTEARDRHLFIDLSNCFFKGFGYVFYRQRYFQSCFITFSFNENLI